MKSLCLSLVTCLGVTACSSLPPKTDGDLTAFSAEARFALRLSTAGNPVQSSSGRLNWEHRGDQDKIIISNPLGYGLAEMLITPTQASLRTANGQVRTSHSPDDLLEDATGFRLPTRQIPFWLTGRAAGNAEIASDGNGRPTSIAENGWRVEYFYDDGSTDALPSKLNLTKGSEIELRLRIEEWKTLP